MMILLPWIVQVSHKLTYLTTTLVNMDQNNHKYAKASTRGQDVICVLWTGTMLLDATLFYLEG